MITFVTGDLLVSDADALVNTVNTVGVMGKGIALQFKQKFPHNYKLYVQACKTGALNVGELLVTTEILPAEEKKIIINFPTKTTWRKPSEYAYIEAGLRQLVREINTRSIKSIAIPPLGAGNGGLDWPKVKDMIIEHLSGIECDILVYEPGGAAVEPVRQQPVLLTPARAMLLAVFYDMVSYGECISEFAAEKITYFLQRFGAENEFRLKFAPEKYGPYSGKLKHVLHYLDGSYISGYQDKGKKAFEELNLLTEHRDKVLMYLQSPGHERQWLTVQQTTALLSGFYDNFALELLSTVDYIVLHRGVNSVEEIHSNIQSWNDRKRNRFSEERFVQLALTRLQEFQLV
ncbi:MAG: Appr-1-p processing protein [Chitinophagia bacterium]|nr:Appr-1-p processing protein [Chitinophagia bacterium]